MELSAHADGKGNQSFHPTAWERGGLRAAILPVFCLPFSSSVLELVKVRSGLATGNLQTRSIESMFSKSHHT